MRTVVLVLALALVPLPGAAAHGAGSLLPGDTLARATPIGLPARVFDTVPDGVDVHYFRVVVGSDADVTLRLAAPAGQEPAKAPVVVVFSPGEGGGAVPPDVERPANMSARSFVAGEAAHEPHHALGVELSILLERPLALAAGEHIVVVRTESAAPMSLLIDTSFAPWTDPFLLPSLRDDVRAWRGDSAWPPLAAAALAVALVASLGWRWRARTWSLHAMGAFVFSVLCAGTSAALLVDAARGGGVGLGYAALGLIGAAAAVASTRPAVVPPKRWQRVVLALAALACFFGYAGAMWGPVAGLLGALVPEPVQRTA